MNCILGINYVFMITKLSISDENIIKNTIIFKNINDLFKFINENYEGLIDEESIDIKNQILQNNYYKININNTIIIFERILLRKKYYNNMNYNTNVSLNITRNRANSNNNDLIAREDNNINHNNPNPIIRYNTRRNFRIPYNNPTHLMNNNTVYIDLNPPINRRDFKRKTKRRPRI